MIEEVDRQVKSMMRQLPRKVVSDQKPPKDKILSLE
jgi:hypothetical protein